MSVTLPELSSLPSHTFGYGK